MKKIILTCFLFLTSYLLVAQGVWTQKADFGGIGRIGAVGFSIGNKGYIGMGQDTGVGILYNDLWEYDPMLDSWTQKANLPGEARKYAVGFSIGNKGYVGTGFGSVSGIKKDFWSFDAFNNIWTQKADFGGTSRSESIGLAINDKGYIGGGNNYSDFWEYDTLFDAWTQKADIGGGARKGAIGFSIGNNGYIGCGWNNGVLFDFWQYNPATDTWVQLANGWGGYLSIGFSINGKGYIGLGWGNPSPQNDFFEYDTSLNSWTAMTSFPDYRVEAIGFSIGNKGYVGTGAGTNGNARGFWEFDPNGNGINETNLNNIISIFPNPFHEYADLLLNKNLKFTNRNLELVIYSVNGVIVKTISISKNRTIINRDNFLNGIYFYKLKSGKKMIAFGKFIVY